MNDWQLQYRMNLFVERRIGVIAFIHVLITCLLILSGSDRLEPLAFNWFWAPILSRFFRVEYYRTRAGRWMYNHPFTLFWASWTLTALVIPIAFWGFFKNLDVNYTHKFREVIGERLGLGGQTGLLIAVCVVFGLIAILQEIGQRREKSGRFTKRMHA